MKPTPPPCAGEGCSKPVNRHYGKHKPKRGYRYVDGVRWCWFCSRKCAGGDKGHINIEACRRTGRENRQRAEKRTLQRLVAACRDVMDENQMVPAKAMVRVMMDEVRKAYSRGATATLRRWECAA